MTHTSIDLSELGISLLFGLAFSIIVFGIIIFGGGSGGSGGNDDPHS